MTEQNARKYSLTDADLLQLGRWDTPSVYNGWEQITERDPARGAFNTEEVRDFRPQAGSMVGFAVTVLIEPSNPEHPKSNPEAWDQYRRYVAGAPSPKIVVVQDLDKPEVVGSFWGEVNSSIHRALGCVGTITDGGVRDLDEMETLGFKALARRPCVGHAHNWPVRWDCEVDVFGTTIAPGQLIHADRHGFLTIEPEEADGLLEATQFMDRNECETLIPAARRSEGQAQEEICETLREAAARFDENVHEKFKMGGEW
ncbi:MAG: RraA family protein [Planctomycetes bacterium]|nr:RraA family protein [Planctomycetota bacterium]